MKKYFYITSFTFLGFLFQLLLHAGIEIFYISLLTNNFGTYSLGLSWDAWYMIHHIGTVVFLILGIALGFWQGRYWWQKLYAERGRA